VFGFTPQLVEDSTLAHSQLTRQQLWQQIFVNAVASTIPCVAGNSCKAFVQGR